MPRANGYAVIVDPRAAQAAEMDTATCNHCQRIIMLHAKDGTRKQGVAVLCMMCNGTMCVPCAEQARCDPFEKKLERVERRGRLLAAMGVAVVLLFAACTTVEQGVALSVAAQAISAAGCFEPVDYGAVAYTGDPTLMASTAVDSRPGIQAAIDAATAAGGGKVCLGDGTWFVTRAPAGSYNRFAALSTHAAGLELAGAGPRTVLAAAGDAGASTFYLFSADPGASEVVIRDLTIDGTQLYNTDHGEQTHAIVIGSSVCAGALCSAPTAHTTVERVTFNWDGPTGERWGDCVRVAGNSAATKAYDTKLLGLNFLMCGRSGIEIQRNAVALIIAHCFFAADMIGGTSIDGEATGTGVGEDQWDDGVAIHHNEVWKLLAGGDNQMISVTSTKNFSIDHNILRGIFLGGRGCITAVRVKDGTIDHNVCSAQEATANLGLIDIANLAENVVLDTNTMRRSGGAGYCIKVAPHSGVGAVGLRVVNNGCVNNTDSVAIMLQGAQRSTVANNDLAGSGGPNSMGVYVSPVGAVVTNLGVTDNRFAGMTYAPVRLVATGGFGFRTTVVALNTSETSGPGLRCDNPTLNAAGGIVAGLNNWSTAATCAPP